MQFLRNRRTSRGDTIVEVMIAIAVVSSVLAGAFSVTQKSSQAVRSSQERGEMLQILNGQIEQVRALVLEATDTTAPIFDAGTFCIDAAGQRSNFTGAPSGACADLGSAGSARIYNVSITYNPSNSVFTATGTWDGLGGTNNQARLLYRISPTVFVPRPQIP